MHSNSKPLHVLGISAFYHDAAAALLSDGRIIAAAQQERFSRKKHDPRFPADAIHYCLEAGGIEPDELAAIAFYDNPALSLGRVLETVLDAGDAGRALWSHSAPSWLSAKLFVERLCRRELGVEAPVLFSEHHFSHAASAFYPSPFTEAAILTIDGVGEWATTTLGVGTGEGIAVLEEIHFPHSLGLLYSAFTQFCGFKVNSGEYKLMGLAPYGRPIFADAIRRELIDIKDDGSYRLNMQYFGYTRTLSMTDAAFHELFGGPPRRPESRITRREMDLAASIQQVTEEVVCKLARHLRERTGKTRLCLAGGVALNCVANGRLLREGTFEDLWIQPAAGDAGGSLGAALMVTHEYFGRPRAPVEPGHDSQRGSYLGPAFSNAEVKAYLDARGYPYHVHDDDERARLVAGAIAQGKVVGYAVGRMEFGPRALGARSILGDPRDSVMQSLMNLKIKFRESFRPFAPSVLRERAGDYFELDVESPYMLLVAPVREALRRPVASIDGDDMIPVINQTRSTLPAITHVDFSARVQTVDAQDKPDFHQVLREFEALTGTSVLVNTSFNVRGEPIVCSPHDAYTCFMRTEIDLLVLENCVLYKHEQPRFEDRENWKETYELD
jgi:carbamoyltransferase